MRRTRTASVSPLLVAAMFAFIGCGGATHGSTTPRPSTVKDHATPLTKALVKAYAHAVNLQAADLPNMRITKGERHDTIKRIDRALARCLGDTAPRKSIAAIQSTTFTSETEGEYEYELIGSDIEAQPSETIAAEYDTHLRSAHGRDCLTRFIAMALAKNPEGIGYAPPKVTRLPAPLPAGNGSFGYRFKTAIVSMPESNVRVHFPITVDAFGFADGPVDLSLTAVGAPEPVPAEAEQRLISLLYSRAHARSL